jgi:hypothetical protein
MSNQEDYFLQSVIVTRKDEEPIELDLSFLDEVTFVETLDLSGPRLMMSFRDPYRIIRDDNKVRPRDILEVRFSDVWGRDEINCTIPFTIWNMPIVGDIVSVNCMQANIDLLKTPAKDSLLFPQKPVSAILNKLLPGLKYDTGNFAAIEDYHLMPGERPSKLVRQMAREKGAVCFYKRGTVVFRTASELLKKESKLIYEHANISAKNQIADYMKPNDSAIIKDKLERNFIGWDMEKGIVQSTAKTNKPPEYVSLSNQKTMANMLSIPLPAIDFTTLGNGELKPGIPVGLKWNVNRIDAPIDESLPSKVLIGTVAHYYRSQKYLCRVKGVIPYA